MASNEELQSTNEELHSMNEELHTVNSEYQRKIEELSELNADFDNFFNNSDLVIVLLDQAMCIRKFTPNAARVLRLLDSDIGRPFDHFAANDKLNNVIEKAREVMISRENQVSEFKVNDKMCQMKVAPYYHDKDVTGVVLTLADFT